MIMRGCITVFFLFGILLNSFTQKTVKISLVDEKSGEPLQFAHLCFEDLVTRKQYYLLSDLQGNATQVIHGRSALAVSSVGYKILLDTITSARDITYKMSPTVFDLDEVVVTAQMKPRKVDNSIYKVSVISSKTISDKAAVDLSELLSQELNLRISQDPSLGAGLSLNGLSGEHVKILIDGIPVIGRMNGNIDLSQLNLYNVDHIEKVEGPMSVQYGSNALAGAINIITKENTRNSFLLGTREYYESVGVYNLDANAVVNKKGHSYSLAGGRNFFSGYPNKNSVRAKLWKPKEQYFLDSYYSYKLGKTKLKADGKYFSETIQNKGPLLAPYFEKAFDTYFFTKRFTGKLNSNTKIGENTLLDITAAYSWYNRQSASFFKDLTTLREIPTERDTSIFEGYLSRGTYSFENESGSFGYQLGYDINYETARGARLLGNSQSVGDYALFLTSIYEPWKTLSLQPGFRLAYNTKYKAPFVPSLNLKYTPVEKLSMRASYVRGFRAPTLKELYLFFVDINHNIRGNENLKSESSHNLNFSLNYDNDYRNHYYGIEINFFDNIIQNNIKLAIDSATLYTYINIENYRSLGGNTLLKYRFHPRLNLEFGYALTGRYNSETGIKPALGNYYYSHDFNGNFNYDWFKKGIIINANYKFTGKYPQFFIDSDKNIIEGYISGYHNLDFTISKSLLRKSLIISAGGKNLFGVTNILATQTNGEAHSGGSGSSPVGWGRTFFISLSYKFAKF